MMVTGGKEPVDLVAMILLRKASMLERGMSGLEENRRDKRWTYGNSKNKPETIQKR